MTGAPGQPPAPGVDTTYGEGQDIIEAQRRMPVPDLTGAGMAQQASNAPGPGRAVPSAADRLSQAMALMAQMSPARPLNAPTERPTEPITTGLAQGPGPGPEILKPGDRATQTLRMLADFADDPGLSDLAERAQRMGR